MNYDEERAMRMKAGAMRMTEKAEKASNEEEGDDN